MKNAVCKCAVLLYFVLGYVTTKGEYSDDYYYQSAIDDDNLIAASNPSESFIPDVNNSESLRLSDHNVGAGYPGVDQHTSGGIKVKKHDKDNDKKLQEEQESDKVVISLKTNGSKINSTNIKKTLPVLSNIANSDLKTKLRAEAINNPQSVIKDNHESKEITTESMSEEDYDGFEHSFKRIKQFELNQRKAKETTSQAPDKSGPIDGTLEQYASSMTMVKSKKPRELVHLAAIPAHTPASRTVVVHKENRDKNAGKMFGPGLAVGMVIAVIVGLVAYGIFRVVRMIKRRKGLDIKDLSFCSMKEHKLENNPTYLRLSQISHKNTGNHYIVSILDDPDKSENELSSEEEELLNTQSRKRRGNRSNNSKLNISRASPDVTIPAALHERLLNVLSTPPFVLTSTPQLENTSTSRTLTQGNDVSSEEEVFNISEIQRIKKTQNTDEPRYPRSASLPGTPKGTPKWKLALTPSSTPPPHQRTSPFSLTPNRKHSNAELLETWRKQNKQVSP